MPDDDKAPVSAQGHAMAQVMLQMSAAFEPVFDAGKGLRAKLEADGWSPTIAEALAAEFVRETVQLAFRKGKK
jgi:hypothetical protein